VTFRRRLIVLVAAAVAAAVALGSVATYVIVRAQLRADVDRQLRRTADATSLKASIATRTRADDTIKQVAAILNGKSTSKEVDQLLGPQLADQIRHVIATSSTGTTNVVVPRTRLEQPEAYVQYVTSTGQIVDPTNLLLPIGKRTLEVARGESKGGYSDTAIDGLHVRMLTAPFNGGALQAILPLDTVDQTLGRLEVVLILVTIAGIALAAGLGVLVSRAALRPVATLTNTAERVSATRDLSQRIDPGGDDELGRLAASFNRMLAALDAASEARRQLVADASHELRTPLASLLMNIELLAEDGPLAQRDRDRLLADVTEQIRELTVLIGDLVDLARQEPSEGGAADVRLDEIVQEAVVRAGRHAPDQRIVLDAEPCTVLGVAGRLERAVNNLLDNAVKWNPPGAPIEVSVRDGTVSVRDHGPGFAPEDLPHVFDRFYRAVDAKGLPGAGLGLAIVRQVAEAHGGDVEASNAPGGGGLLTLRLPVRARLQTSYSILEGH
jgi:two-component system sensor histidine kinase MprB